MSDGSPEETVRVVAEVPAEVKETAKEKLEYGGLSREIQETLERIAYGEELTQRSRLERRREELNDQIREKREERREIDAEIETLEQRKSGVEEKLSAITSREDKFEAKLESVENRVRVEGVRVWDNHPAVQEAAACGGVETEGVIQTLKERNPDVPDYAFQQGLHDPNDWNGLPDEIANRSVGEREGVSEE